MKALFQILVAFLAVVVAEEVRAQFALMTSTADGGGTLVSGGAFTVHGTVGQPDAANSAADGLVLAGGFWPALVDAEASSPLPEVRLNIVMSGGQIQVRWPVELTNWVLEAAAELPDGEWDKIGTASEVEGTFRYVTLTDKDHPLRYFRLRSP